ncbi:hypothetical protein ACLOJK_004793 [Asimina triloba]
MVHRLSTKIWCSIFSKELPPNPPPASVRSADPIRAKGRQQHLSFRSVVGPPIFFKSNHSSSGRSNSHPNQPPDPAASPGQQHPSSLFHGVRHLRAPPHPLPDPFDLATSTHLIHDHDRPISSAIPMSTSQRMRSPAQIRPTAPHDQPSSIFPNVEQHPATIRPILQARSSQAPCVAADTISTMYARSFKTHLKHPSTATVAFNLSRL